MYPLYPTLYLHVAKIWKITNFLAIYIPYCIGSVLDRDRWSVSNIAMGIRAGIFRIFLTGASHMER